ncbi:MAG: hypothetical protein VB084_07730 [Syntrophomonadaceae bacterium]|nr:hypothetical protein [Syntrophomonadaceae bacterium]
MDKLNIIGIRVDNRGDHATSVQKVLTSYGTKISGRFGVPARDKRDGLIAIVMEGDEKEVQSLTRDLLDIKGVDVNSMNI